MRRRAITAIALILLATAACKRDEAAPDPVASESEPQASVSAAAVPQAKPSVAPSSESEPAPTTRALDPGALSDRRNPDRVLRFYAEALEARDWTSAAKVWGANSGVTAQTLKASYDRADPPMLEVGRGEQEGAAGSLYYEAPVILRFGSAPPERGSLVLKRVNDVDGATAEQLRWHIERSTIGQGQ